MAVRSEPAPPDATTSAATPDDASRVDSLLRRLAAAPALAIELEPGTRIADRYTIERRIGRGGMGVVYRAHDRELDRRVALKLHRSLVDPRAAARTTAEARAMARLAHPNVVTVHEVGDHAGQVFIVMEWVDGLDLRAWLAAQPRSRDAIIDRFLAAGEGLAAAHAAGLVHRDFKPSNVLIGGDGRVRVADFGLARGAPIEVEGAAPSVASPSSPTHDGARAGTPAYMSPEQAEGRPCDARSDQFSFCVALWEALHGALPARGGEEAAAELPGDLVRGLRRGLRERPEERFPDMPALLDALRPERARRRRRRAATGAALAAVATISLSLGAAVGPTREPPCVSTAWQPEALLPEARRAELAGRFAALTGPHAAEAWPRVEAALTAYAAALSEGSIEACADTHERRVQSAAQLDLRTRCLTRARRELAARLTALAAIDEATLASAVPLATGLPDVSRCADPAAPGVGARRRASVDAARVETVEGGLATARARVVSGDHRGALERAAALVPEVAALAEPGLTAEHRKLVGDARLVEHDAAGAREDFEAGYLAARAAGDEALAGQLAAAIAGLQTTYLAAHRDALMWARIAGDELARGGGDRRVQVDLLVIEGSARAGLGELTEALSRYDAAAKMIRTDGSPRPDHLAVVLSHRGAALERMGHVEAAIEAQERALEVIREALGAHHPKSATALNLVGAALQGAGRHAEAELRYQEALAIAEAAYGPDSPAIAPVLINLSVLDGTLGRFAPAIARLEHVRAIYEAMAEPNPEHLANALTMLGEYYGGAGEPQRGLELLDRSLALLRRTFGEDSDRVAECRMRRGELLANAGEVAAGLAEQLAAAAVLERTLGPDSPILADSLTIAGQNYAALGRPAEAEAAFVRALGIWERADSKHFQAAFPATFLGALLIDRGRAAEALPWLERAVEIREAEAGKPWRLAESRWHLARALWEAGGPRTRAIELAGRAREGFAARPEQAGDSLAAVERFLAAAGR